MTWAENNAKGITDTKEGRNNKRNIAVDKLDLDGTIIATYYSVAQASRDVRGTTSKICEVCKGARTTHKGFKWQYATNSQIPTGGK